KGQHDVLYFPRKSIADYVVWENPFLTTLTAVTVGLWVQLNTASTDIFPFSYSSRVKEREICIRIKSTTVKIYIRNSYVEFGSSLINGYWHHLAITWDNTAGQLNVYVNGSKIGAANKRSGNVIHKGALILGQDQGGYMKSFSSRSLQGNLTNFNMWNKVLSPVEIASLASDKCSVERGNLVDWRHLRKGRRRFGLLQGVYSPFCKS
ncbi:hypothetical protein QZH41_009119, partial [Actinostola sp. cb2023]